MTLKKRERDPKQGWARHRRNLDGRVRAIQKKLRCKARDESRWATTETESLRSMNNALSLEEDGINWS